MVGNGDRVVARHAGPDFVRSVAFAADGAVAFAGYDGAVGRLAAPA